MPRTMLRRAPHPRRWRYSGVGGHSARAPCATPNYRNLLSLPRYRSAPVAAPPQFLHCVFRLWHRELHAWPSCDCGRDALMPFQCGARGRKTHRMWGRNCGRAVLSAALAAEGVTLGRAASTVLTQTEPAACEVKHSSYTYHCPEPSPFGPVSLQWEYRSSKLRAMLTLPVGSRGTRHMHAVIAATNALLSRSASASERPRDMNTVSADRGAWHGATLCSTQSDLKSTNVHDTA